MTTTQQKNSTPAMDKKTGINILLVEDSLTQALRFSKSLESNGYHVHWFENGHDGLQSVKQQKFDLIILDVELPDINGFEICRRLKADPEVTNTPVIMLTTRDRAEDALNGLSVGANDYIPKDAFAELVLLETIRQMSLK